MKIVIETDPNGNRPTWALNVIVGRVSEGDEEPYLAGMLAVGILDALADGPQPIPAPYDIEIPDFVNRHGTVSSE